MRMRNSFWIAIFLLTGFASCKPDLTDDAIPYINFPDIVITNLSLPEYADLNSKGWIYLDGGIRGLILYKSNASTYLTYERNCSYHPNEAGATVDVDVSGFFMIDYVCKSSFSWDDGTPTGGPAWRPLRRYKTYLDGSKLTITSESANGM